MHRNVSNLMILLAALTSCGEPEAPAPRAELLDATLAFGIAGGEEDDGRRILSKEVTTFLAVEKEGRTSLVDAWQDAAPEGTRYGRHNFPPGTTATAMAGYYWALLKNTGWREGADFELDREHGVLRLFGVSRAEAGSNTDEVEAVLLTIPATSR